MVKIISVLLSLIIFININTVYECDGKRAEIIIRNNINGDFDKIEYLADLKPGAFINIVWNKVQLMLPYSPRKDLISFSDKKWEWSYLYNDEGYIDQIEPELNQLLPSGAYKSYKCRFGTN